MAEVQDAKSEVNVEVRKEEVKVKKRPNTRRWCSVPMCKARNYRSLHKFPRDPELRKKWVIACRIGKKVTENMLVCRDHFLSSDFIPRWDGRLRRLKIIAIPSQNLPTRPLDKKLTPAQLKRKEDRATRAARRLERVLPRIIKGSSPNNALKENTSHKKMKEEITNVDTSGEVNNSQAVQSVVLEEQYEGYEALEDEEDIDEMNFEVYVPPYPVCTCKVIQNNIDCYEVRAAKVLLEFNEIVDEMMKSFEIIFPIKDIVLKRVEEFYQCARRSHKISFYSLLKKDNQLHAFTGIDFTLLNILVESIAACEEQDSSETELCNKEKITLSLIKLRWNVSFSLLANLFHISEHNCISIFHSMIQILKSVLKSAIYWPTQEDIMNCMPESLENFKKTIVVMDRTEISVKRLICPKCDLPINSEYNGNGKLKILLGFSKSGLITYVSKVQHGVGASNETIDDPNFISKILVPSNDAIMNDSCFIEQDCNRLFIELIKDRTEKPFDPESLIRGKPKEAFSTDIDRAYKRFQKFRFLKSIVSSNEASLIDDVSVVISGIVNLGNSVIVSKFSNL